MTESSAARASLALRNLPPFPPVACKVARLLREPSVSFREVAETLRTDAGLCSEVLRLANSALAGPRFPVRSILEALAVVGTERLAGLMMTLSLSKLVKRAGPSKAVRLSWRHSLACALAAREFEQSFGREAEEAYQAGLLHDVGRLALLVIEPKLYDRLIAEGGDLRHLEKAHFGVDHCEAGVWLVEQWKLPTVFAGVAGRHHDADAGASKLMMVVQAGCKVANELGFAIRPAAGEFEISDKLGFRIAEMINGLECEYGM